MITDHPVPRPPSEQLVDLHVYILPREAWNEKYSSTYNESISEATSAGFVRVWPELTVAHLRMVIEDEIGHDFLPPNYVFLRSVGRCMTQVKPKQEHELKCKAFLPPTAWAPEIVVLEPPRNSVPLYQSFPGYSPRVDTTQPINGIPTHFPQVANHDRIAPSTDGQSPMMVQQQGYKGDPLQQSIPGKSGRPDAYTNNTNEDSGIAEPTPEEDDPDYERRKSDIDDQYFNQLEPNQTQNPQFQQNRWDQDERYDERAIEEERRRQAEIQEREEEEERRKEEERKIEEQREVERQREEERKEQERRLKKRRQDDAKKEKQETDRKKEQEQQRKEEQRLEEERMKEEMEIKEAERLFEQERRQSIAERERAEGYDEALPLGDGDDIYNDTSIGMDVNQTPDSHSQFLDDEQMRRRAEEELRDYEPQSSWKPDDDDNGTGRMSHALHHPGRRSRSREDTEMEIASQQAVQDGLKRVHLTPEVHRKAKIGKIRNSSITDEEDIYETDPEMAGLLEQLQIARQERMKKEKERETLIKKAKELQTKTHERRNRSLNESKPRSSSITPDPVTHPRDYWKKRYYDEKKKTAPLEEQSVRVRNQLDIMHRKLLSHIEGKKKGPTVKGPPSKKNDHKINIIKMQHELDELKRKVDNSRMKLTSEIKLRNQAEAEVRGLKSDLTQRKINMTLIRNQKLAALKTADSKLLSKTPIPALGQGPSSFSAKR